MTIDNLNKIEKQFFSKAIIRGGIFLLDAKNVVDFILECQKEKKRIFGIDAFFLSFNTIQPSLENSLTYLSNEKLDRKFYEKTIEFITQHKDIPSIYFEVVCE